jgi:hypothetical protein
MKAPRVKRARKKINGTVRRQLEKQKFMDISMNISQVSALLYNLISSCSSLLSLFVKRAKFSLTALMSLKNLQHLGLWEESQTPPEGHPPIKTGYLRSILQLADIPFSAMFAKNERFGNLQ